MCVVRFYLFICSFMSFLPWKIARVSVIVIRNQPSIRLSPSGTTTTTTTTTTIIITIITIMKTTLTVRVLSAAVENEVFRTFAEKDAL